MTFCMASSIASVVNIKDLSVRKWSYSEAFASSAFFSSNADVPRLPSGVSASSFETISIAAISPSTIAPVTYFCGHPPATSPAA